MGARRRYGKRVKEKERERVNLVVREGNRLQSGSRERRKEGLRRGERWLEASWLPWMANRGDEVGD